VHPLFRNLSRKDAEEYLVANEDGASVLAARRRAAA
jgi:hypothetical protein